MAATAVKPKALDLGTFRAYRSGKEDKYPLAAPGFTRFCKALSRAMSNPGAAVAAITYERHAPALPSAAGATEDERRIAVLLICANPAYSARVILEPAFIFALCDLLFGGSGTEPAYQEDRPLSHIEKDVGTYFAEIIGEQLPNAFQSIKLEAFAPYKPASDGLSEAPEFKPELRVTLLASLLGFSGDVHLECNAALTELLTQRSPSTGDDAASANPFSSAIVSRVEKTDVEIAAILATMDLTLGELSNLKPGQLVKLATHVGKPVTLESDGVPIREARLGQQSRRFCVSVL